MNAFSYYLKDNNRKSEIETPDFLSNIPEVMLSSFSICDSTRVIIDIEMIRELGHLC